MPELHALQSALADADTQQEMKGQIVTTFGDENRFLLVGGEDRPASACFIDRERTADDELGTWVV